MIIGETISHYRVVSLLGAGGMGEVYKAEDTRLKRAVALKFLPLALVRDEDAKQRLLLEAQAASALDHPNICTIHEIDETPDGRVFIAMAYYDGETLKQRIERGGVSIDEALDIIGQVARGVAAAHDAEIIHRDIKPANILLCSRAAPRPQGSSAVRDVVAGGVKLLDFGIAKLAGQTAVTRTGSTVGTIAYMSPEQISGQAIDARTDVWSLGVVLYELVAGRLPFSGQHDVALLRAIADDDPRPLAEVRSDVPAPLASVIAKALQKDVRRRYASVHEFLEGLAAVRGTTRTRALQRDTADTPSRRRLSSRTITVASVAVLIAATMSGWLGYRTVQARRARQLIDDIRQLQEKEQYGAAFRRMHTAPAHVLNDAGFVQAQRSLFLPLSIDTDPSG